MRQGFIWGAFSIITATWSFFMVPETKGLSLEQLDYLYDQRVPTRQFRHHVFSDPSPRIEDGENEEKADIEMLETKQG